MLQREWQILLLFADRSPLHAMLFGTGTSVKLSKKQTGTVMVYQVACRTCSSQIRQTTCCIFRGDCMEVEALTCPEETCASCPGCRQVQSARSALAGPPTCPWD